MTVYNGMPYLELAIESILNQTESNFQFVIVDDGSDAPARQYLESLTDDRITLIRQSNQGTAAAANRGLKECTAEFVARMDADDIAMRDRLEKQLAFLRSNSKVGLVGSQVAPLGSKTVGRSLNLPTDHATIFAEMMEGRHGLAHSSLMIRRSVLDQIGGYWSLPLIDDWDMMLRMGEVSELTNLDEVLLHYRVHAGSLNGKSMKRMQLHIAFAVERAKRRQSGETAIDFEAFKKLRSMRPAWAKLKERADIYALANYRIALADIQGARPLAGWIRLAWASICSPARTLRRLARPLRASSGHKSSIVG